MYTLDKNLAIRIVKFYATSALPMEEVAYAFNRSINQIILTKNSTSKCIYHCLFYRLVDEETEKQIISKITSNVISHTIYSSKNKYVHEKYERLKCDRDYYEDLKLAIKQRKLNDELNFSKALDIDSFISSDDERDYVPPKDELEILKEIELIELTLTSSDNPQTQSLISRMKLGFTDFEKEMKTLENKYKLN